MGVLRFLVGDWLFAVATGADAIVTMREPAWQPHLADDQTFPDAV
jgi:hypothetical protein